MRRLLIRPGAIGDLIVSLPALEILKTDYLEVWAAEQNLPLIQFADRVQSITSTGLDMLEIEPAPQLVERLRGFDSIVSWYGSGRPEFRAAVAGLGLPFQFFPALPVGCHAVDFFVEQALEAAEKVFLVRGDRPGRLSYNGESKLYGLVGQVSGLSWPCSNKLKLVPHIACPEGGGEFAVIHPFASGLRKRWPLEKFREVARRLAEPVCWCAGPEESLDGAVRIADLYELACWLARARVYIGNDSGISHLAAAVGTPVVALFGPTDPGVWAPRGRRVRVLERMESVEVADVLAAVQAVLDSQIAR